MLPAKMPSTFPSSSAPSFMLSLQLIRVMSFSMTHVTIAPKGVASENQIRAVRICDLYACIEAVGAYDKRRVDREKATGALCIMREMNTRTESPIDALSEPASRSTAADDAEGKEEAAPRDMPSARAWKRSPIKVEKAGDRESSGSSIKVSLNLRVRVDDAATVK